MERVPAEEVAEMAFDSVYDYRFCNSGNEWKQQWYSCNGGNVSGCVFPVRRGWEKDGTFLAYNDDIFSYLYRHLSLA